MPSEASLDTSSQVAPTRLWRNLVWVGLYIIAVLIAYEFIDRQIAAWIKSWITDDEKKLSKSATLLAEFPQTIELVIVAVVGGRALLGQKLCATEVKLLQVCFALAVAAMFTAELKNMFGRAWPETWVTNNPSYFHDGVYGFFPFHGYSGFGGQGFRSFPSGHMTAIGSVASAIALLWPRLRPLAILMPIIVAVGLLGADFHWFSDIIAGTGIGFSIAYLVVKLPNYLSAKALSRTSASV